MFSSPMYSYGPMSEEEFRKQMQWKSPTEPEAKPEDPAAQAGQFQNPFQATQVAGGPDGQAPTFAPRPQNPMAQGGAMSAFDQANLDQYRQQLMARQGGNWKGYLGG